MRVRVRMRVRTRLRARTNTRARARALAHKRALVSLRAHARTLKVCTYATTAATDKTEMSGPDLHVFTLKF